MALQEGLYRIRFVPSGISPPFVGGLYATATELGEPILAEAEDPKDIQIWEVHNGQNGKFIITQPGFQTKHAGIGPVLLGWSLANSSSKFPGGPILFKVNYLELELEPTGQGENVIYSIKVPNPGGIHSPGLDSEFYVTEKDHTLVSQAFWSTRTSGRPHPHWQFIPVQKK